VLTETVEAEAEEEEKGGKKRDDFLAG